MLGQVNLVDGHSTSLQRKVYPGDLHQIQVILYQLNANFHWVSWYLDEVSTIDVHSVKRT